MYKPLSDSTLMGMTKKEIIELIRIAERNAEVMRETLIQQAENCQKLLAEARKHGHWVRANHYWWACSECNSTIFIDRLREADRFKKPYCPHCGAKMDEEAHHEK